MNKIIGIILLTVYAMNVQAQFSGQGSGTEKDPYQITNADELFEVRNDLSAYYKMMNDIDLTDWIKEESLMQGWAPIGNESAQFEGCFDGDNYSIKGLTINRPNSNNIGLFGIGTGIIKNIVIANSIIIGGDNVGSIVGKTFNTVENCHIINSQINGRKNVGGIIGFYELTRNASINNNSFISGKLSGSTTVGGIAGFAGYVNSSVGWHESITCKITNNIVQTNISSDGIASGLIGGTFTWSYSYYSEYANVVIENNISSCRIIATGVCGGMLASEGSTGSNRLSLHYNINTGNIRSTDNVYGISPYWGDEVNYSSNFCLSDTLFSESNISSRIGGGLDDKNYAYNGMILYNFGKQVIVEDGASQGIGLGLRTLKKETTYVGAGFDFTSTWTIKEGETLPYLRTQVAPVTITSFEAGNKATIKGTATEGTTVYVVVGDNMYESYILDGQWEVALGRINVGSEAKVYAMSRGKMPSVSTKAIAESGSQSTPAGKPGDANGDGVIDSADVTAIINYILGKPSASFNKENADVTGDGQILIDDAVQTVQLIMNAQ